MRMFHLAVLLSFFSVAHAQEPTRLKFTLDWVIDGQQAPFLLTQSKGYFAKEGLNVTLDAGTGSTASVQRVVSGTYDMGYGDSSALIEYLSKNPADARVQAVYMVQEAMAGGVMTLKKHNIAGPKDLAGRTIGAPIFDAGRKLFPLFARAQGFDPASVKWQNVQPGLNYTLLARGQLDVASGFPTFQVRNMESMGVPPQELVIFLYKDHGVQLYGNAILVNTKFAQDNPKAVAAFLRAYNRGLKDAIASPDEGIAAVRAREPTINEPGELQKLRALMNFIATPGAKANGLGSADAKRLERQVDDVALAFGLERKPPASELYTPNFLPPRAERSF